MPFISHSFPFVPHLIGATGQNSCKLLPLTYYFLPRASRRPVEMHSLTYVQSGSTGELLPAESSLINGGQDLINKYFLLSSPRWISRDAFHKTHQKILVRPSIGYSQWWPINSIRHLWTGSPSFSVPLPQPLNHASWDHCPHKLPICKPILAFLLRDPMSDTRQGEINVMIRPWPKKGNCKLKSRDGFQRLYESIVRTQ